ncbi:MAG TPA: hypothetical protein VGG39_13890 [Polyangiaceae bacterium]|jgi:hypothetical protein
MSTFAANFAETLVAMMALVATMGPVRIAFAEGASGERIERARRIRKTAVLALQAAGAVAGIGAVHWALRSLVVASAPWLCEQPAQLVNDAVAAASLLVVVWACARNLDPFLLGVALAALMFYGATAPAWHMDRTPTAPLVTVQSLVVIHWASMALALGVFRSTLVGGASTGNRTR